MSTLRSSNLRAGGLTSGAWQAMHHLPHPFRQEILPWRPREADPGGRSEMFVTKIWERDVAARQPIDVGGEGSSFSKPIFVICDTERGNHTSIVTCVIKVNLLDEIPFASPDVRRPLRHPVVSSPVKPIFVKKFVSGR